MQNFNICSTFWINGVINLAPQIFHYLKWQPRGLTNSFFGFKIIVLTWLYIKIVSLERLSWFFTKLGFWPNSPLNALKRIALLRPRYNFCCLRGQLGAKDVEIWEKNDFSSSLFLNSVKIAEHFDTKIDKIGRNLRKLCLLENENLRNKCCL